MTYHLTLSGENPSELAQLLTALSATRANGQVSTANGHISAPAPALAVEAEAPAATTETAPAPAAEKPAEKAVAPKKTATKTVAPKKAALLAKVAENEPADPLAEFGDAAAATANGTAEDYDFELDLGIKTTGWTVEEVREKAKEVVTAGKQLQLREHLNQFGAASISTLEPDHYDAFMKAMNSIKF